MAVTDVFRFGVVILTVSVARATVNLWRFLSFVVVAQTSISLGEPRRFEIDLQRLP
jgi:hypothetical protein